MLRRSKSDASDHAPTRVLVVNDDADACELIARIVESAGWSAVRVHSHDEAITSLIRAKPSFTAVLVDFQGGTAPGLALLDAIRSRHEVAEVPVLLLSHNDSNRLFAWESGADGFLVRPFHSDDLVNELYATFSRSPDERRAYREEQLEAER